MLHFFLARCHQKHKIEPLMKPMSFLDHRALYKGSVTLGRLFNHSAKHPNMKLAQYCELFATPQGPQPLIFAYLYAVREIQVGWRLIKSSLYVAPPTDTHSSRSGWRAAAMELWTHLHEIEFGVHMQQIKV